MKDNSSFIRKSEEDAKTSEVGDAQMGETVVAVEQKMQRNIAVDAYRGLVMLLMMGEVLQFSHVARSFPNSLIWRILAYNQSHVE